MRNTFPLNQRRIKESTECVSFRPPYPLSDIIFRSLIMGTIYIEIVLQILIFPKFYILHDCNILVSVMIKLLHFILQFVGL